MIYREVTYMEIVIRLLAAVVLGGILGLERGMKNRPAGFRTYMLVCVGSSLIMLINQYVYQVTGTGDPVRLSAQVISGIGFLGAGTIIVTKHNQIKGLTTAAGLWTSAGMGLALGIGFYEAAIVSAVIIFVVMAMFHRLDDWVHNTSKIVEVYVEIGSNSLGSFIRSVRALNMEIENIQIENDGATDDAENAVIVTIRSRKRCKHNHIMQELREISGVKYLVEL